MARKRTLTVNCGDDADCQCRQSEVLSRNRDMSAHSVRITVNLSGVAIRTETLGDREYRVVPVVMARADVVMNEALVPESEFFPDAWNGVPVTVGHPETPSGGFLSANDPSVLETWAVGQIFNARVEGGALKAEAWIDVVRANRVRPTLIDELSSGTMDVSTGYWSKDEKHSGTINGKTYNRISRDLLPDHLALLPGDVGACSWEDGCGVRNKRKDGMSDRLAGAMELIRNALGLNPEKNMKTKEQIVEELRTNKRGPDDDHRMMVADLISNDLSPYLPEDMYALAEMSHDSLVATRDAFLAAAADDEEEEPEASANSAKGNATVEGGQSLADKENESAKKNSAESELPQTVGELNALIANAVKSGIEGALPEIQKTASANALSAEDRDALEQARKIQANHRAGLVSRVVANSNITKDAAEKMELATLETVANGLRTPADYSGRPLPAVNSFSDEETEEFGTVPTVDEALKAHRENQKVN